MAKRAFLHVGTPKSGTTYLQAVLWQNVESLRQQGVLLPGHFQTHYAAAKGVTTKRGSLRETKIDLDAAWPRLVRQINDWAGDALISHELLSPATRQQADEAKSALQDSQIHIVLTARALHKQIPASWQQQVKGGLATRYDVYVQRVADEQGRGVWFWEVQDLAAIAHRWGGGLPPDRVHIVTVPHDSSEPTLLWRRYATVLGVDPTHADSAVSMKNVSLGPVESELLRRVHAAQDDRFTDGKRHRWTRKLLAVNVLGQRPATPVRLPDDVADWLAERSSKMIKAIGDAGYDVVGDLDDLVWRPPPLEARLVSTVTRDEIAEASAWTIARLQEQLVRRQLADPAPSVGPTDGVPGILELLEHIRAADTESRPRPAPTPPAASGTDRVKRSINLLRSR